MNAIPWNEVKADYLAGITPRELAKKYKIKAKTISDKANEEFWVGEKSKISEKIRKKTALKILKLTDSALLNLEKILNDDFAKYSDKIQAAKAVLDVSGLKTQKQEITGKDGEPLGVVREYILPEEVKTFEQHYKEALKKNEP